MSDERADKRVEHPADSTPGQEAEAPIAPMSPDWGAIAATLGSHRPAGKPEGMAVAPKPRSSDAAGHSLAGEGLLGDTIHYSLKQTRRVRDVLTRIHAVRRAAHLYPFEHPAVVEGVRDLLASIHTYFDEGVELQIAFFEGELLLGDQVLTEESVLFDQLISDISDLGVGSLVFRRGLDLQELIRVMSVLSADLAEVARNGGIEKMAAAAQAPHVAIAAVVALDRTAKPAELGEPAQEAQAAFSSAVSLLREIDRLLKAHRTVSPRKVKGVVRSLVDNVLGNRYAMLQLTGLKNYDEYTFYHSANVAILSLALGSAVSSDYRFLASLGTGALLHDIGKLAIDLSILNKPGPLAADEWDSVREHPVAGAEMTALLPGIDKTAIVTILEHHMRWDGTGYPSQTPHRKQHLTSRIVAVADSYDAMTSQRSYSAPRVQDEAMALLARGAGSALDPVLVRLFIGVMGMYPPRSVVRLSTGDVAIVLAPAEHRPLRPLVRVIAGADGQLVEPRDLALVNVPEIDVEGCIDPRLVNIEVDDYI